MNLEMYEVLKQSPKEIICDICKKDFVLSKENIQQYNVLDENKKTLRTTFFVCPHCNKVYIVLLENGKTDLLNAHIDKLLKRTQKHKRQRKDNTATQEELDKMREKFITYQFYLKRRYEKYFTLRIE